MPKVKLVQKGNPLKKDAPKKWYGIPESSKPLETKAMTRAATQNTTTAPFLLSPTRRPLVGDKTRSSRRQEKPSSEYIK